MPIYEYRCSACQNLTEKRQNFSDAPLTTCEACGGPLERLISAPRLHFKGTGWYITDYAKSNGKGSAGDGKGSSTEGKSSAVAGKSWWSSSRRRAARPTCAP